MEDKILKVHSLNDYIIDLYEPLGKFAYVMDCVKCQQAPEYWIIDNPFKSTGNACVNEISVDYGTEEKSWIKAFNVSMENPLIKKNSMLNYSMHDLDQYIDLEHSQKKIKKIYNIASHIPEKMSRESNISENKSTFKNISRTGHPIIHSHKTIKVADPVHEYLRIINDSLTKNLHQKLDDVKNNSNFSFNPGLNHSIVIDTDYIVDNIESTKRIRFKGIGNSNI